jgi:hypothetical protein
MFFYFSSSDVKYNRHGIDPGVCCRRRFRITPRRERQSARRHVFRRIRGLWLRGDAEQGILVENADRVSLDVVNAISRKRIGQRYGNRYVGGAQNAPSVSD